MNALVRNIDCGVKDAILILHNLRDAERKKPLWMQNNRIPRSQEIGRTVHRYVAKRVQPPSKLLIVKHLENSSVAVTICTWPPNFAYYRQKMLDSCLAERSKMWRKQKLLEHLESFMNAGTPQPPKKKKDGTKERLSDPESFSSPEKEVKNPKRSRLKTQTATKGRNQLSTPRHDFFWDDIIKACNGSKEEEVALLMYKLPWINTVFDLSVCF